MDSFCPLAHRGLCRRLPRRVHEDDIRLARCLAWSSIALLWAVVGCAIETPTPPPLPTATSEPVTLRIAYTSDSLGYTDPVVAVDCG